MEGATPALPVDYLAAAWVVATVVGAVIAWFLGSLPSTLIDMGGQQTGAASQEPPAIVVSLLAAGMGLFLGAVLGIPQWLVLRRVVKGAWLWIPANCLAWALGMPVIFAMVDRAYAVYAAGSIAGAVVVLAGTLALAGAVVGAVHGLALVKLAPGNRRARFAAECIIRPRNARLRQLGRIGDSNHASRIRSRIRSEMTAVTVTEIETSVGQHRAHRAV